jgi:hypothetical protein
VDEVLQVAETAIQADEFDARNNAFYAEAEQAQASPVERAKRMNKRQSSAHVSRGSTGDRRTRQDDHNKPI